MILVIPVSHVDIDLAENLAHRMVQLGDIPKIVIVSSWKAWWDIHKVTNLLSAAQVVKLDFVDETGWPESANHMFMQTAELMAKLYPNESFYFMEPDTCPIKKRWFQTLEKEHREAGKPYTGVISNSIRMVGTELKVTGKHMTGTAIYPADFLQRCKAIHYLARDPWDIEIGPEILPEVNDTKLIAHRWSSYGYYMKDGVIHITGSRSSSPAHTKPIPPEAVVIHGNKDGSVYALTVPL